MPDKSHRIIAGNSTGLKWEDLSVCRSFVEKAESLACTGIRVYSKWCSLSSELNEREYMWALPK